MKNKKSILLISIVIAISLIVIVVSREDGAGNVVSPHGSRLASSGAVEEQTASDFTLPLLSGGEVKLSDYRGNKPVILDFFATWCPNCQRDMPRLSDWYEQYKNEVGVIGVNLQERTSVVEQFISSEGISFPIALDASQSASRLYNVRYTNYHVLIDIQGNIAGIIPGDIEERDIVALIELNKERAVTPDSLETE